MDKRTDGLIDWFFFLRAPYGPHPVLWAQTPTTQPEAINRQSGRDRAHRCWRGGARWSSGSAFFFLLLLIGNSDSSSEPNQESTQSSVSSDHILCWGTRWHPDATSLLWWSPAQNSFVQWARGTIVWSTSGGAVQGEVSWVEVQPLSNCEIDKTIF